MNKGLFILITLTACFCACSKDDSQQEDPAPVRKISIEVVENPMVMDGDRATSSTRGSAITTSTLTAFSMNYGEDVFSVSKSGDTWITDPPYWPEDDYEKKIVFYAYKAGSKDIFYDDNQYISFEVDELVSAQIDLLVATDTVSYNDAQGTVSLTFDHACAAVDFQLCISNTLWTNLGRNNLTINSVVLTNVMNKGKYYYSTGWDDVKGSASYTLTTSSSFGLGTELYPLNNNDLNNIGSLFMIPQTLGAETGLRIQYTVGGIQKQTFISMSGHTWEPGVQYTEKIKLGTGQINLQL